MASEAEEHGHIEWHVMIGTADPLRRLVGLVEAVDEMGITVARMDEGAERIPGTEVRVGWEDVVRLMQSGPDRDDELFAAESVWRGRRAD